MRFVLLLCGQIKGEEGGPNALPVARMRTACSTAHCRVLKIELWGWGLFCMGPPARATPPQPQNAAQGTTTLPLQYCTVLPIISNPACSAVVLALQVTTSSYHAVTSPTRFHAVLRHLYFSSNPACSAVIVVTQVTTGSYHAITTALPEVAERYPAMVEAFLTGLPLKVRARKMEGRGEGGRTKCEWDSMCGSG